MDTLLNFIIFNFFNTHDYTLFHQWYYGLFVTNICMIKGLSMLGVWLMVKTIVTVIESNIEWGFNACTKLVWKLKIELWPYVGKQLNTSTKWFLHIEILNLLSAVGKKNYIRFICATSVTGNIREICKCVEQATTLISWNSY